MPLSLVITAGEPAGIGPDVVLKLAANWSQAATRLAWSGVQASDLALAVIADPELMRARAKSLGLTVTIETLSNPESIPVMREGCLSVIPVSLSEPATAGKLNTHNADYVLKTLAVATDGCLSGQWDGMVTAPVHKGVINESGVPFTGHTEFLQDRTHTEQVVMMLATEGLRVALVTTHLPLRAVADAITPERIKRVSSVLYQGLQTDFGLAQPRILVCGLNPHAGEDGHLGREELDIIIPTLTELAAEGIAMIGPLPADTLFAAHHLKDADAVLAMYHDQGLPVLKHAGFGRAANITLGMPIVRTSVDHGTALDLAGTGLADEGSLWTALGYAALMANARQQNL
ncbi:4-hydroxythreonine-4-phosphate dehydrogenase [Oceanospirillum multiglobuliferum]|uniref:4-hydroxythreonine-4-phosphate dehydrogenase n=1 Tax=Oceanospirillum multiglobuliferum TaxID=64969 RepID=A0A1T4Q172_9GAMM|nr:4-hydroxythreonine-4-phosphate dehydrogenase PdxA [Oceanospirillum multiglobuliferum]SJZ97570.1 4-hydroxythreonine-4-phosphate dehydrogenase [Oceanospirillum multiglobuliferum]